MWLVCRCRFAQDGPVADKRAGSFGTHRIPDVLRVLEKEAIMQAREWNVVSLNEFRAFFHLKPLETFEEINPDPAVAATLAKLYPTANDVELYPGLIAEAVRTRMDPAEGLCRMLFPSVIV